MKKWAFAITVAFFAVVSVAAAAVAVTDEDGGSGQGLARDADDRGESGGDASAGGGGGAAGICIEGTVDCVDTPDEPGPGGDGCVQIFPTPPECTDPDAPVTNDLGSSDGGAAFRTCLELTEHNTTSCGDAAVAISTRELAGRLGSADGITLKSLEQVDWPDSCLGVNQADVACAEVISPGYRVILEANGQIYEYHTQGLTRAVLVE